jgi:hypothetical protein
MSAARFLGPVRFEFPKTATLVALAQILVLAPGVVQAAPIAWKCDYREALEESASRRLPVFVVIGARWCRHCRKMQAETLCNAAVAARIAEHFIPLLIDADQQGELVEKLKVSAFPTVLIISPERMIIGRHSGFQSAAQLNARLASYETAPDRRSSYRPAPPQPGLPLRPAPDRTPSPETKSWAQRMWDEIRSAHAPTTLEAAEAFSRGG